MASLSLLCWTAWLVASTMIIKLSKSHYNINISEYSETSWDAALKTSMNLRSLQNSNGYLLQSEEKIVALVYPNNMWHLASIFRDECFSMELCSLFLDLRLDADSSLPDIETVSKSFEVHSYKSTVETVVIFSEDHLWLRKFIQDVCSNMKYNWTHLVHLTEWIVMSVNSNIFIELKPETLCLDFVTFIKASNSTVQIARKSRGIYYCSSGDKQNEFELSWSVDELKDLFVDLRTSRKSSLEGLTVPVAFIDSVKWQVQVITNGNETTYDGFAIAMLNELAAVLGFTYSLVLVEEIEFGYVNANGTATGIVGMIARREVAFCAHGMHKIDNRLQVIDFLSHSINSRGICIMYALPDSSDHLDATLIDIISSEYYILLIGPFLLMVVIGGLTHFVTRSCTMAAPVSFRKQDLWKLTSFPDHICFQRERKYEGQTARVLRASWAVFFVIFSAAYSAYLVTTFTVKPQELKIDSFETLLNQENYRFGVHSLFTSLVTLLKTSKPSDVELYKMWELLVYFNKTDPWTFSSNDTEHMLKVLEGGYAFILSDKVLIHDENFQNHVAYSRVRSYPISNNYGLGADYMGLPYDVFYKDELDGALLHLEELGVLKHLRYKYGIEESTSEVDTTSIESNAPVPLSRISLLMYVTLVGVAASLLSLILEILVGKVFK